MLFADIKTTVNLETHSINYHLLRNDCPKELLCSARTCSHKIRPVVSEVPPWTDQNSRIVGALHPRKHNESAADDDNERLRRRASERYAVRCARVLLTLDGCNVGSPLRASQLPSSTSSPPPLPTTRSVGHCIGKMCAYGFFFELAHSRNSNVLRTLRP